MKSIIFKIATACLMASIWFAANAAEPSAVVMLSVSHPKESTKTTADRKSRAAAARGIPHTEVKASIYEYSGKVSCNPPKDTTTTVTLEAYFIVRPLEKGAHDELCERKEIGKFEFGGENPKQYKFEMTSPEVSKATVKEAPSLWNAGNADKQKYGERLMGVIVRAIVDGKPVKVISEPSNSRWVAAGKKDPVALD